LEQYSGKNVCWGCEILGFHGGEDDVLLGLAPYRPVGRWHLPSSLHDARRRRKEEEEQQQQHSILRMFENKLSIRMHVPEKDEMIEKQRKIHN
jgi:hypothetical protein